MAIIGATTTGLLKESNDALNELRASLSRRFNEATERFHLLAQQLIDADEKERMAIGQELHDGIGQSLTCMLLHSEALHANLKLSECLEADLAERMVHRVEKSILGIRQLSRSLLPIQFTETNLETALDEMVAYFNETTVATINLEYDGNSSGVPSEAVQHLHRITHGVLCRALEVSVKKISVHLTGANSNCRIRILGEDLACSRDLLSGLVSEVMKFRIEIIGGNYVYTPREDCFTLEYWTSFTGDPL